jgi:transposase-like protein
MAKTRPPYTPEFRRQMVELVHAGRSPEELAQEFEPTAQSIRNWVGQTERNAASSPCRPRRSAQCRSGHRRLISDESAVAAEAFTFFGMSTTFTPRPIASKRLRRPGSCPIFLIGAGSAFPRCANRRLAHRAKIVRDVQHQRPRSVNRS